MKKQLKPKSSIIYNGPSLIDGKPIIVVAILASSNSKTGNMLQTHILRADIDPTTANRTGEDYSICGNCPHRGIADPTAVSGWAKRRSCYVNLGRGPSAVFEAYKKGKYPIASDEQTQRLAIGRMVRIGTYGDPLAVPQSVWDNLTKNAKGHTSYTHQHQIAKPSDYLQSMASADSEEQALSFHSKGVRTFRVIPLATWQAKQEQALLKNEILCPASEEGGVSETGITCSDCKLCKGSSINAKSIAIVAHGQQKHNVSSHGATKNNIK